MTDRVNLFAEDWDDCDYIVHNSTQNKSFLDYSNLLKQMGVKNHKWPLQLHNPDLEFVDPFQEGLDPVTMVAIRNECRDNPFYYFREIARAPGHTPENPKRLLANRGNMSMYWLYFNALTVYLIQIRQTGKSLSMDHLSQYLGNIYYRSKLINLFTKDDKLRTQNMERLREIAQYLPFYLSGRKKSDVNNTEEIHWTLVSNRFKGHIPATSKLQANSVGRGFTAETNLVDELAFLRWVETSLPAYLAGGNNARAQAEKDGIFYGTVMATTAGKKDDEDGAFAYKLVQGAAIWDEAFFDAQNRFELYRMVKAASPDNVPEVHCSFNHRQLGYTDQWLYDSMRAAKVSGEAADRDFGNVWTDGSQSSPLTTEDTKRVRHSQKDPYTEHQRPWPFLVRWFQPAEIIESFLAAHSTIASFDPSEAIGRDDCTVTFRDIRDGSVVGAANINEVNTIEIAKWIVHILVKYPKVTLIPENKLNGSTIIDYIIMELVAQGIDPFKRIFNMVVNEHVEFKDRYKTICTNGRIPKEYLTTYRRLFGFKTSAGGTFSRDALYGSVFMAAIKYTGDKVYDKVTIDQILSLVVKNDRIDHAPGNKDDLVISWLLSYWFLTHARNLSHYGINPREVLSLNRVKAEDDSVENLYDRLQQQMLRQKVDSVVERLAKEEDRYIAERLEQQLKHLETQLNDEDRMTLAADDLIEQLRDHRRGKRRW